MYNSKAKEEHKFGEIGLFLDPNMEKEIDDNDEKCTTCDKDTEGGWIQCDSCLMWEHLKCIGMNKEDIPKAEEGYICDKCKKKPSRKVKRARIVEMMNAIYGFKGSETFTSKIKPVKNSKSSSGNENYNFEVLSSDGNKMENIVILYSCGKSLNDLIRSNDVKTPDPKKYINDFEITDIQFCTHDL